MVEVSRWATVSLQRRSEESVVDVLGTSLLIPVSVRRDFFASSRCVRWG
jgi:hypothetical protein